jgi:hypothetical protein
MALVDECCSPTPSAISAKSPATGPPGIEAVGGVAGFGDGAAQLILHPRHGGQQRPALELLRVEGVVEVAIGDPQRKARDGHAILHQPFRIPAM